ncbi:metal ABC transporter permease [Nocardioides sp. HDW12B]|uniref:metal ABC transporter permease n=1 Tax=Nocardioides sp. HDW12B TaxID=2714939 RepID=UPI00140A7BAD|nr:metal ABC transporter permease [Nocardioides sp. HDW12B]QIK65853.1 metal ABC transporter permease [Nocardioides sp. HDW12B]
MSILALEFMQRALLAAVVTGLAAPAVGTYLVQRRQALMGDGIGHVAVTGVAIGLLTQTSPVLAAVVVAIIASVVVEIVRERGTSGDVALALMFYGGIAGGLLLTGLAGQGANTLNRYLFGSIVTVDDNDLWIVVGLATAVVALSVGLAPRLFAITQDPDFARVAGVNVRAYNMLVSVLAAVTVTVAMRTVGLLLVSALMVVPVATVQQVTRTFRATLLAAMVVGTVASVSGLMVSAYVDVQPGATIVLIALAGFALAWPVGMWSRSRLRRRQPFGHETDAFELDDTHHVVPEDHGHLHGPDCGHLAVRHGDHVDYVHDGHRHAPHGSHYDEH